MCNIRFAIILVTYNRLDCLKIALEKYERQTKIPAYILVVDNASNDGTKEYLEEWMSIPSTKYRKIVIRSEQNTGGSGGFSYGLEEGCKLDCDFLFLADDDAYAEPDMLEKLSKAYQSFSKENVSALCTAILNHGKYEISHRCHMKKGLLRVRLKFIPKKYYNQKRFRVDILTFVGAAIKKDTVKKVGLPKKEYFIYYDDTEYSLRLLQEGSIYCIPDSIMHHDTKENKRLSWKYYYDTRNWIDLVRSHYPRRYCYIAAFEKYIKRCTFLAYIFRKQNRAQREMCSVAIRDALDLKLGKNEKYCPQQYIC